MATEYLPPILSLVNSPQATRHGVLALLFEPSPCLYTKADPILATTEFDSYDSLITAIETELQCLEASDNPDDLESLNDILSSHPRLGEKKVESALSRAEQAAMEKAGSASSDTSKEEEQATLKRLNAQYEAAFPGLRYVYVLSLLSHMVSDDNQSFCQRTLTTSHFRRHGEANCSRGHSGRAARSHSGAF
jgi:2-oxo-4-hydroxy-4-carboxy--5-ureidoimidazoline (OHCU) decarboxylase